jgi:hypothetical protein
VGAVVRASTVAALAVLVVLAPLSVPLSLSLPVPLRLVANVATVQNNIVITMLAIFIILMCFLYLFLRLQNYPPLFTNRIQPYKNAVAFASVGTVGAHVCSVSIIQLDDCFLLRIEDV